jgi:ABC-2 type transport system ATP-binding protein
VAESVGIDPALTGRRILEVVRRAGSIERSRVDEVLELTAAAAFADRKVRELSTGMRQRIALAVALLGDPACLVLDEPLTGLDPDGIRWLRQLLRQLAGEGKAILLSSHVLAEAEHTVDEVVVIKTRLLYAGGLRQLTAGRSLEDRYFELAAAGPEAVR